MHGGITSAVELERLRVQALFVVFKGNKSRSPKLFQTFNSCRN